MSAYSGFAAVPDVCEVFVVTAVLVQAVSCVPPAAVVSAVPPALPAELQEVRSIAPARSRAKIEFRHFLFINIISKKIVLCLYRRKTRAKFCKISKIFPKFQKICIKTRFRYRFLLLKFK
jgi:hypothetical protein